MTDWKKSVRLLKSFEIDEKSDDLSCLSKNLYCGMDHLKLGAEYDLGRERQLFQGASWEAAGAASHPGLVGLGCAGRVWANGS